MYNIIFSQRAVKDFNKLEEDVRLRIASKLEEYSANPLEYARKFAHESIGNYRFRIGDYRVVFDLGKDNIVSV